MRRQRVPLGKAAWATRRVSSGIERAGCGWSDMGRWSKGSPVRWSGTSPSAPDLRITPWEGGRWNSPPVSVLGLGLLPLKATKQHPPGLRRLEKHRHLCYDNDVTESDDGNCLDEPH